MTDLIHPPAQPTAKPLEACARCGAPLADDQRWCLNCGTRRHGIDTPFDAAAAPAVAVERERTVAAAVAPPVVADRPPRWLLGAVGAGLAAVLFGIGLVVGLAGQDRRTLVSVPPGDPPVVNVEVQGGGGVAAPADSALTASSDATPGGIASDWPKGKDGWTVQLDTLKGSADQTAVDAAKADAEGKGAPDVGALLSDDYASLDPNKVVVYSGVFDSKAEAQAALNGLKGDFPKAEVVEVSETGASAEPVVTVAPDVLEDTQSSDPEEQQEASKKLPDKVGTTGTPPPTDNAAPGGGTEGTTIG